MRSLHYIILAVALLLMAAGCETPNAAEQTVHESFNKEQAVERIIRNHPEFTHAGETKSIETITGGPAPGTKVSGSMSTSVEPASEHGAFIVTLTKDWDFTFSGKKLSGYWKYKVTSDSEELLETKDNTDLIRLVK